jgi:hypothetical protein
MKCLFPEVEGLSARGGSKPRAATRGGNGMPPSTRKGRRGKIPVFDFINGPYLESIHKVGFQRMIQSLLKGAHPVGRLCQPPALHLRRFTETPYSKAPFSLFKLMTL